MIITHPQSLYHLGGEMSTRGQIKILLCPKNYICPMAIEQLVQNATRLSTIQISIAVSVFRHCKPGAAGPLSSNKRVWVIDSL